jgi:hypothetical protein
MMIRTYRYSTWFFSIWAVLLLAGGWMGLHAQQNGVLTGGVFDTESGLPLEGATVVDLSTGRGGSADGNGRYRVETGTGRVALKVSFLGYGAIDTTLEVNGTTRVDFYLSPQRITYEEVQVTAREQRDFTGSVQMGEVFLDREQIGALPKLLGEADPVRFLQLTPGVQSGSEGGIGFFVRGGSVDQNLILYDNTLIYNPGHLLGFVSVFNPDIISEVSLLKSGIPARFGGRLSSVVRVNPDRGRSDSLQVRGQAGIVASRIAVNRSFANDRGSFIFSGRTASIDLLVKPLLFPLLEDVNPFLRESSYRFYDFSGGLTLRIGNRDQLQLSSVYGEDLFAMERSERMAGTAMSWGNFILTGKWNHSFSDRLTMETTVSRTDYHFDLSGEQSEFVFGLLSSVSDRAIKGRVDRFGDRHKLAFGYELQRHLFTPNRIDVDAGGLALDFLSLGALTAFEGALFAEDEIAVSERVGVSLGMRYSFFAHVGPYTEYLYDAGSLLSDSIVYAPGDLLAFYHHPEPRVSAVYRIDDASSFKAGYMHMAQYVHLGTSSTVSLPTDIWLPSTREIAPQVSDQVSFGYYQTWQEGAYEGSAEVYFKHSRNQVEFLRGVISSSLNLDLMENIAIGKGRAYGLELFLRRKRGRLTGWGGYALSRSERMFDMINDGRVYPAKFDRRHDLSLASVYALNDRWNASAVFVFVSGNAFTLPVGRYVIQGNLVNQYGRTNNYRMPAYHRLDLSLTRTVTTRRGNRSIWDISVYNLYNRSNPFYIYFETSGDLETYSLEVEPVIVSLFPVVPSVSWRFEF